MNLFKLNQLTWIFIFVSPLISQLNSCNDNEMQEVLHLQNIVDCNTERRDNRNNVKYILYWNKMFKEMGYFMGLGQTGFMDCEYKNCFTTEYSRLMPVECFDAIIFHIPTYCSSNVIFPLYRSLRQRYVFFNLETPVYWRWYKSLPRFRKFFNWTLTYRLDSDISNPYGTIVKSKKNIQFSKELVKNKTHLVAWFVSNCKLETTKRTALTSLLSKYVEIDIYGKCGNLSCPQNNDTCYEMLENNYKFYLSFENAYCQDYVTEKLFKILQYNVVPVVYGWVDYKKVAPPHSVINVEDFDSVENLAEYLLYLDENDEKYLEYFQWKKDFQSISSVLTGKCNFCKKLNTDLVPKVYDDLIEWWTGSRRICKFNSYLPKITHTIK